MIEEKNYYGNLCTEMYEILHAEAPQDELNFYLSYAEKGKKILEPLCGSGRFLVPFVERGLDISGIDLSNEMLQKLKQKLPEAKVVQADIIKYSPREKFDYIFISSGSVSLFTDTDLCKQILCRIKEWLSPMGKFVFAVDTIANRCTDDNDYAIAVSVKTKENFELVLKSKNHYDEQSQTQLSPGIYEMYSDTKVLRNKLTPLQIVITNGYTCSLIYYLLLVTTTMFIFLSTSTWAWIISSGYLIFYNVYSLFHTSYKINCLNRWGTE